MFYVKDEFFNYYSFNPHLEARTDSGIKYKVSRLLINSIDKYFYNEIYGYKDGNGLCSIKNKLKQYLFYAYSI